MPAQYSLKGIFQLYQHLFEIIFAEHRGHALSWGLMTLPCNARSGLGALDRIVFHTGSVVNIGDAVRQGGLEILRPEMLVTGIGTVLTQRPQIA